MSDDTVTAIRALIAERFDRLESDAEDEETPGQREGRLLYEQELADEDARARAPEAVESYLNLLSQRLALAEAARRAPKAAALLARVLDGEDTDQLIEALALVQPSLPPAELDELDDVPDVLSVNPGPNYQTFDATARLPNGTPITAESAERFLRGLGTQVPTAEYRKRASRW
jgi:hypothetical protein